MAGSIFELGHLPVEVFERVLLFLPFRALCMVALANRQLHQLALPQIYAAPILSALPTLLSRPDLARLAKRAVVTWDSDMFMLHDQSAPDGRLSQPLTLSPTQIVQYSVDGTMQALLELCYPPAQTTLLLRVCPNLDAFSGRISFEKHFFATHFPSDRVGTHEWPAASYMQNITKIELGPCARWRNYDRPYAFDGRAVMQMMLLPSLRKLKLVSVLHGQAWSEELAEILPHLYGVSSVTHLDITGAVILPVLQDLIRLPMALSLFRYQHLPLQSLHLTDLACVLLESPSSSSLDTVSIIYAPNKHEYDVDETNAPLGDLSALGRLPSLRMLVVDGQDFSGRIAQESDVDRLLAGLPPKLIGLALGSLRKACDSSERAVQVVRQVVQTLSLVTLVVDLDDDGWTSDDIARVAELAKRHGLCIK
jgi:hypothetical protein